MLWAYKPGTLRFKLLLLFRHKIWWTVIVNLPQQNQDFLVQKVTSKASNRRQRAPIILRVGHIGQSGSLIRHVWTSRFRYGPRPAPALSFHYKKVESTRPNCQSESVSLSISFVTVEVDERFCSEQSVDQTDNQATWGSVRTRKHLFPSFVWV